MFLPGKRLSQRIFSCHDDNARQTFQIFVGVRNPIFIFTASPRLHQNIIFKFTLICRDRNRSGVSILDRNDLNSGSII